MRICPRQFFRPPAWAMILVALTPASVLRASEPEFESLDRSPVALALSPDARSILTANQTSGTVSLIDLDRSAVRWEIATGEKPSGVAFSPDGKRAVVTHWYGYDLVLLDVSAPQPDIRGRVEVGPEPRGVVLSPDGSSAYIAVGASNEVVRVDLDSLTVTGRLSVDREPRGIALSPDGSLLAVSNARAGTISIIDRRAWRVLRSLPTDGVNLRQVAFGPEGRFAYVANMHNRGFSTTRNNIDIGWVLGQRLTRVPVDGSDDFSTISLDPQGQAAADAHGVAISSDGVFLAVSLGGTHEVMILRTDGRRLPWRTNGSRDLIEPQLLRDDGRFRRVPLKGRPTEITFAPETHRLYVANYLENAVQVVDAENGSLLRSIDLGGPESPSLARQGEILFHDARMSFNQWYSCNTCHSDGHTNGQDFDTLNDGWQDRSTAHERSRKKVPTLRRVTKTGPWTWHGWQTSLEDATIESITKSMQGNRPSSEQVEALVAYLGTLEYPRNPNNPNSEAAQ
ncbi:MAG TPA: cytochrome c peroxidase, partial [Isosphaeraceae bacterium]|nr:cytochrome c peroxidase [Isosphaeraceae bacterium]